MRAIPQMHTFSTDSHAWPHTYTNITVYYLSCLVHKTTWKCELYPGEALLLFSQYCQKNILKPSLYQLMAYHLSLENIVCAVCEIRHICTFKQPTHTVQSINILCSTVGAQTNKHIMSNPHEYQDPR